MSTRPSTRLLAGVVAIGLLGVAPVVLASPGVARDTWTTTTVAEPSATSVTFGDTIDVTVDLDSSSGSAPTRGTSTLLALRAGATAWAPVATSTSPGGDFYGVKPSMNTTYKVAYGGYDAPAASNDDSYDDSESATFAITVARRITHPRDGFVLKGRVTPSYRTKPIAIRVSSSSDSGFTKFRRIVTDSKGRYAVSLPKRDGTWYWRVSVRGDSSFAATSYTWETKVFH